MLEILPARAIVKSTFSCRTEEQQVLSLREAMFWRKHTDVAELAAAAPPESFAGGENRPQTIDLSVIDFGEQVSVGSNMMKGFCATGGGSDEIQACIWKVDAVNNADTSKPRIHIEF